MKFVKVISVLLLIAMIGCMFVACNNEEPTEEITEEKVTEPAPTGEVSSGLVEITVSFDIKDNLGKNIYHVSDYNYKGFNPSILGVLDQYFKVEIDVGDFKVVEKKEKDGVTEYKLGAK